MTTINLKNNYFIATAKNGYHLKHRNIRLSNGEIKETVKKIGYYNTLESTIELYVKLMRDELLKDEILEIKEYARLSDQCAKIAIAELDIKEGEG